MLSPIKIIKIKKFSVIGLYGNNTFKLVVDKQFNHIKQEYQNCINLNDKSDAISFICPLNHIKITSILYINDELYGIMYLNNQSSNSKLVLQEKSFTNDLRLEQFYDWLFDNLFIDLTYCELEIRPNRVSL